ncbi:MAG: tetratricopeptide repeat protein [Magnetococcales bacterium]|nr:tetratricopeptide repeat protein [Magnetococcales bacterium]
MIPRCGGQLGGWHASQVFGVPSTLSGPDWWQIALACHLQGALSQAEACYRLIDENEPEYVMALGNLAVICNARMRWSESESLCRLALTRRPDFIGAYVNLANALLGMGRLPEAAESCRQALSLDPAFLQALITLGNVLTALGEWDEAESLYRQALRQVPDSFEALMSLGNLLAQSGRLIEAEGCFRDALELRREDVAACNNLGNVLTSLGRFGEAHDWLMRALERKPNDVGVLLNLGLVLNNLGKLEQAEWCYRTLLTIDPDNLNGYNNLLFMQNYYGEGRVERALEDARQYGARVASRARPFSHRPDPSAIGRRLRIGLVSGDLLNHPVGYFLDGVLPCLDAEAVELYVYSNRVQEDALTERLKRVVSGWIMTVGLQDAELAQRIHADRVDILMDLSGHSARNRLSVFAWKPAPIQVTWLGYFATTGVAAMDYILGDPYNLPENETDHFCERPWRLPDCYLSFTPPDPSPPVGPLPALTQGYITFGSFNNPNKMTDAVVACWSAVLQAVPGSRLFLKSQSLLDPVLCQSVVARFEACGIGAERLLLEGPSSRALYLTAYHRVDVALDSFPYPGVTTSVEGLWMGVPFVTRKGGRYLSHQGESILSNVGLSEWIAEDCRDYVSKAVALVRDVEALARLRLALRERVQASPLLATRLFADNLVRAWQGMWRLWCEGGKE